MKKLVIVACIRNNRWAWYIGAVAICDEWRSKFLWF